MDSTKRTYRNGIYYESWLDQTYRNKYHLVIAEDLKDTIKLADKITGHKQEAMPENADAMAEDFVRDQGHNVLIIFSRGVSHGTIAHEVVHAVNATFSYHGMKLDVHNDEHQAYYTGALVDRIVGAFYVYDGLKTQKTIKADAKLKKKH